MLRQNKEHYNQGKYNVLCAQSLAMSDYFQSHGLYLPGSSVHGDSPCKNTEVGCHALLQGIFPTQESNLGRLHCWQILII